MRCMHTHTHKHTYMQLLWVKYVPKCLLFCWIVKQFSAWMDIHGFCVVCFEYLNYEDELLPSSILFPIKHFCSFPIINNERNVETKNINLCCKINMKVGRKCIWNKKVNLELWSKFLSSYQFLFWTICLRIKYT